MEHEILVKFYDKCWMLGVYPEVCAELIKLIEPDAQKRLDAVHAWKEANRA